MYQSSLTEKLIGNAENIAAGKYREMTIFELTDALMDELTDTLNAITEGVRAGIVDWQEKDGERVLVSIQ